MANHTSVPPADQDTISDVFRYLVKRSGKQVLEIAQETGLPTDTLYALHSRKSKRADIRNLRILAEYFGEDLSIFCGLKTYHPPRKLTAEEERLVNDFGTLTDDAKLTVLGLVTRLRTDPKNLVRLI